MADPPVTTFRVKRRVNNIKGSAAMFGANNGFVTTASLTAGVAAAAATNEILIAGMAVC